MDLFPADPDPRGPGLDLGATATYARRTCWYVAADPDAPWFDGRLGTLTIEVAYAKGGKGGKVEADEYAVEEGRPLPGLMGRRFLLTNPADPAQEEPYRVTVGGLPGCTCKAGAHRARLGAEACKHLVALTKLTAAARPGELVAPAVPALT